MSTTEGSKRSGWGSWLPFVSSKADTDARATASEEQQQGATIDASRESTEAPNIVPDLTGVWKKDEGASDLDSYYKQIELFHLSAAYKYVAKYGMWGLDIKTNDQGMDLKYLVKGVPAFVFREVEHFRFDGPTTMGRRDHRSGKQTATTAEIDDGIQTDIIWGDPYAGHVLELYTLPDPDTLHLMSTLTVGGQTISSLQVYRKS